MTETLFRPSAYGDMLEAGRYYETKADGLGVDFLLEIEKAVAEIREFPKAWPVLEDGIRKRILKISFQHPF